jgi:hypothetical protein
LVIKVFGNFKPPPRGDKVELVLQVSGKDRSGDESPAKEEPCWSYAKVPA